MGFRSEMAAAREEIHAEFGIPGFYAASGSQPVWEPLHVRVMTKGMDPLAHMLEILEIRQDNPVFIVKKSDVPGAKEGSLIACSYGVFRMLAAPQFDTYGFGRAQTERLRGEPSTPHPEIPEDDPAEA